MEKVYENALGHRLVKLGLDVKSQCPLTVRDEDGTIVGEYLADLFINGALIVELKPRVRCPKSTSRKSWYMRASGMEHGLLLNFGATEFYIKKFVMSADRKITIS